MASGQGGEREVSRKSTGYQTRRTFVRNGGESKGQLMRVETKGVAIHPGTLWGGSDLARVKWVERRMNKSGSLGHGQEKGGKNRFGSQNKKDKR